MKKAKRVNVRRDSSISIGSYGITILNARRYGSQDARLFKVFLRATYSSIERLSRLCKGAQKTTVRHEVGYDGRVCPRVDFLF